MAFELDIQDDYLMWERLEPISVYPSPRNDLVRVNVARAKRRAPTTRELAASNGAYTATDLVWLIPRREAPSLDSNFPLKPGDLIEADDIAEGQPAPWTILAVQPYGALRTFWRVTTRNLRLAFGLRDAVSILRPTVTQGDSAEPLYTYPPAGGSYVVQDLAARVQPTSGGIGVANAVETAQQRFNVILGQQVDLLSTDRVLVTQGNLAGQLLRWTSIANEERIDELPALECMRVYRAREVHRH